MFKGVLFAMSLLFAETAGCERTTASTQTKPSPAVLYEPRQLIFLNIDAKSLTFHLLVYSIN